MKKLIAVLLLIALNAFGAGSTINSAIPSANSPLQSAPMRGNFAAAAGIYAGARTQLGIDCIDPLQPLKFT